jgi:mannose-6-phosphate isomerase-like protein (cupin superfamily)
MHAVKLLQSQLSEHEDYDFYELIGKDMTLGLEVGLVKLNKTLANKPLKEHDHLEYEQIYYIRSGRGILRIDGEEQEVEKDMVIYIPAGASHGMRPFEGEEALTYIFISHFQEVSSKAK